VTGDVVVDYVDVREKCSSEAVGGGIPAPKDAVLSR
jgi:hypothetical protein